MRLHCIWVYSLKKFSRSYAMVKTTASCQMWVSWWIMCVTWCVKSNAMVNSSLFSFFVFLTANTLPKHAVLVNLSTCHLYPFLMGFPWKFGRRTHPRLSLTICTHRPNKLLVKPNHLSLLKRPQGLWFQRSEPLFFWRNTLAVSELKKKKRVRGMMQTEMDFHG